MALQSDEITDRQLWNNTFRLWYKKAIDKDPNRGELYHHLATLMSPYTSKQLSLYARSLTCVSPSELAKADIISMFNQFLSTKLPVSWDEIFMRAHAMIFGDQTYRPDEFDRVFDKLGKNDLAGIIISKRFNKLGVFAAISNIAALFEYGTSESGVKAMLHLADPMMMKNDESSDYLGHPFAIEEKVTRRR